MRHVTGYVTKHVTTDNKRSQGKVKGRYRRRSVKRYMKMANMHDPKDVDPNSRSPPPKKKICGYDSFFFFS